MQKIVLLGAGKIGRMIAKMLAATGEYDVLVADRDAALLERVSQQSKVATRQVHVERADQLAAVLAGRDTVISALSYRFNPAVAQAALAAGASYYDLTEDIEATRRVRKIAEAAKPNQVFVPQCGLAPGFISIVANHLTKHFDELDTVRMRVGALPQFPSNALKYNLTWSTDGLINEYCNPCEAIHDKRRIEVLALEGLEHFSLDGVRYEAFNTSGGIGTLCETLEGRVRELNYKTIRYVGHRELAALLVSELRLSERRELLKDILEYAVPITFQDVVVTFCTVTGHRKGQLVQISDARKIYGQEIDGERWSAIQITTAAGLCAVLDLCATRKVAGQGFVKQEEVSFDDFIENRFGKHYESKISSKFVGHAEDESKVSKKRTGPQDRES
jgi:saccharopine dehydrogenase-like NADP-dependent oxidoreductase